MPRRFNSEHVISDDPDTERQGFACLAGQPCEQTAFEFFRLDRFQDRTISVVRRPPNSRQRLLQPILFGVGESSNGVENVCASDDRTTGHEEEAVRCRVLLRGPPLWSDVAWTVRQINQPRKDDRDGPGAKGEPLGQQHHAKRFLASMRSWMRASFPTLPIAPRVEIGVIRLSFVVTESAAVEERSQAVAAK